MKGWRAVLVLSVIYACFGMMRLSAAAPATILIVEIQTGSNNSTGEDFVELYNLTDEPIDLTTWRLDYRATGSASSWSKKAQLVGSIEPRGKYLVSTKNYLDDQADAHLSSGLSKDGGSLRLVRVGDSPEDDEIVDLVGWGAAQEFAGSSSLSIPKDGQSLKRNVDEDGMYSNVNDGHVDFMLSNSPTPSSSDEPIAQEIEPELPDSTPVTDKADDDTLTFEESVTLEEYPYLEISELFVDPQSPLSDTNDEFIEIYNSGSETVNLEGYVLQTGLTYNHSMVLSTLQIAPGQYIALPSSETKLSLSNSGSRARIVGPSGRVIFETPAYESAKTGQSFSIDSTGNWQWTSHVTPGASNVISQPVVTTKPSTTKPKTSSVSSKKTASAKSSSKSGSTKSTSPKAEKSSTDTFSSTTKSPRLDSKWLVGLGLGTVLYASWEYRDDIGNKIYKLRRHRIVGRGNRAKT